MIGPWLWFEISCSLKRQLMEALARQQEQGILCKHSTIVSLAGTSELADIYESCVCNGMKFAGIR